METRKLQQVGGGTYTVSIPKAWAEEHGLEAGTTLSLYTYVDGSLLVRTTAKDEEGRTGTRIEITDENPETVRQALEAAYAIGFDVVTLTGSGSFDADQRLAATETARELVGIEIVEEDADELTARNLLDAADVSIRQSLVQLQFVARTTLRQATRTVDPDVETDPEIGQRADEADRLFDLLSRHFDRSLRSLDELDRLEVTRSELFDYYETARQLNRIVDLAVGLNRGRRTRLRTVGGTAEGLCHVLETIGALVDDATTAVLDADDLADVREVLCRCDEVRESIEEVKLVTFGDERTAEDGDGTVFEGGLDDAHSVRRLLDDLVRVIDRIEAIAKIAIRSSVRNDTAATVTGFDGHE